MKSYVLGAGLALAAMSGSAHAATVEISYQGTNAFGSPGYQRIVYIDSDGIDGRVRAGMFRLTGNNGMGNILAFCVDLMQYLGNNKTYETDVNPFSGETLLNIDRLYSTAFSGIIGSDTAAAFQVALWEIISDTADADPFDFDLSSGSFSIDAPADVIATANGYLNDLSTAATGLYDLTFLTSDTKQDLVTGTLAPVPLPSAGLLMLAGLGGFAAVRRRKSA